MNETIISLNKHFGENNIRIEKIAQLGKGWAAVIVFEYTDDCEVWKTTQRFDKKNELLNYLDMIKDLDEMRMKDLLERNVKYINAAMLPDDGNLTLTIKNIMDEEVFNPNNNTRKNEFVLYFNEVTQGFLIGGKNRSLDFSNAFSNIDDLSDLKGMKICLFGVYNKSKKETYPQVNISATIQANKAKRKRKSTPKQETPSTDIRIEEQLDEIDKLGALVYGDDGWVNRQIEFAIWVSGKRVKVTSEFTQEEARFAINALKKKQLKNGQ